MEVEKSAKQALVFIWSDYIGKQMKPLKRKVPDGSPAIPGQGKKLGRSPVIPERGAMVSAALEAHRMLIFGKGSNPWTHKGRLIDHETAVKVLEKEEGQLPKTVLLRCRVRYFTDGAILGSAEFVHGFIGAWQRERDRRHPPKVNPMRGTDWGDLAVIQGLRRQVFG